MEIYNEYTYFFEILDGDKKLVCKKDFSIDIINGGDIDRFVDIFASSINLKISNDDITEWIRLESREKYVVVEKDFNINSNTEYTKELGDFLLKVGKRMYLINGEA